MESEEILTDEQRDIERLYLGLRTSVGLPLTASSGDRWAAWVSAGWAETSGDRVHLRPQGWLLLDALVRDLTGPAQVA